MDNLKDLLTRMREVGVREVYSKTLAANDNSKNQVYLGPGFGSLNLFPHGEIVVENGAQGGAVRARRYAPIRLYWIDRQTVHEAPNAKLILYPRYPEVRLSGFLLGCESSPSELLGVNARIAGRILILGIHPDGRIIGYVVAPDHQISSDIAGQELPKIGVFSDLTLLIPGAKDPRDVIAEKLVEVASFGWLESVKLDTTGIPQPYVKRNAAGYTLEASLGIKPNGRAEPDYEGWEVKQYEVRNFKTFGAKSPVTVMTPEPDGGLYNADILEFMRRFSYPDKSGKVDRVNCGGKYAAGLPAYKHTGLRLELVGFDLKTGKLVGDDGKIVLLDSVNFIAASWSFDKLLAHWEKKHARAAYVPCLKHKQAPRRYQFSERAHLFVGTDFMKFIRGIAAGWIYLDPALETTKLAGAVVGPVHRRCQFRISHKQLHELYDAGEVLPAA